MSDNPSAFPWCGDLNDCPTINMGMTLRDYFAGQALAGISANPNIQQQNAASYATYCYAMADAMLKARSDNVA